VVVSLGRKVGVQRGGVGNSVRYSSAWQLTGAQRRAR
jgi:hypothetical protein